MICITCKGRFIPVFKCCPRDSGTARWHFSGSFVHTCQENCDVRWEMAAAAAALAFARVQLNQQNPAEVQRTSATRTNACAITVFVSEKKQHNHFICCWHGPFQSHNSSQLQCANVFCFFFSNNHRENWKGKKKKLIYLNLLAATTIYLLWPVSFYAFLSQIIDTLWWLAQWK